MSGLFAETHAGDGLPVIFLHGFGGHHGAWKPVTDRLPADARWIAYDLPGHGRSLGYPEAGPPKVAVKAILADLAARGVDRAHFVGHSMGGAIATLIVAAEPARTASLTLLAPGGYGPEINAGLLRRYAAATTPAELQACLSEMAATPAATDFEALARLRAAPGQTEMLERIGALITRDGRQGVIPAGMLEKIAAPVAVLWGEADSVVPFSQTTNLPAHFRLTALPSAGHMLIEEAPAEIVRMLAAAGAIAA